MLVKETGDRSQDSGVQELQNAQLQESRNVLERSSEFCVAIRYDANARAFCGRIESMIWGLTSQASATREPRLRRSFPPDLRSNSLPKTNERPPGRSLLQLLTPVSFSPQKSYLSTLSFVKTVGGPSRIWLPLMILSLPSLPASSSVSPGFSFPSITARIA